MDWVNNMGHYFVFGEVTGALICQSSPSSHTSHNYHHPSLLITIIIHPSLPIVTHHSHQGAKSSLIFTSFTIYQRQHQIEHHHHHLPFNVKYASSYLCSLPQPPQCPMLSNPLQCTTSMFSLACLVSGDLAFPPKQLFPMPHHLLFTALPNVSLYPLLFTALPNAAISFLLFTALPNASPSSLLFTALPNAALSPLLFTTFPYVSPSPLLFTALPNFSPSPLFFKCQYTSLLFSCPGSSFLSVTNK